MSKSSKKPAADKPAKPHPDFPLFPHATGRWAKKVRGKLHYFGKIAGDPKGEAALNLWLERKDFLLAGRKPRANVEGMTIHKLVNVYLAAKRHLVETGELTLGSFKDLFNTCKRVGDSFGWDRLLSDVDPDDFKKLREEISQNWGLARLGNEIQRVRSLFRFAHDEELIQQPVRFGAVFKKPTKKSLRIKRAQDGPRMLEAEEIARVVDAAGVALKAMALLGLNCGFGNRDVAKLPTKALDLDGAWVTFPRVKTGIQRRCPLWPETVTALRDALVKRPKNRDSNHDGLVFITKYGRPWQCCEVVQKDPGSDGDLDGDENEVKIRQDDAVAKEFRKLLDTLGIHRKRVGFYALRHTFETIGGDTGDQVAVDAIMGHVRDDMASHYRERIFDDRLKRVTEHVRAWWLAGKKKVEADANKEVAVAS